MISLVHFHALALSGLLAQAAPPPPPQPADDLSRQLDDILTSPGTAAQSPRPAGLAGSGLMNPDISIIFDGVAGAANRTRASSAGDDPDLSSPRGGTGGFTVQEVEIGFQSTIDPYLHAGVFLTIPNLEGVEVEEAYASTTSLPGGLQVKAGVFRSAISRQNEQHLHVQSFTLRPLINQAYLGTDGLRSPGLQVSWLVPAPFFLRLAAEAMTVERGSSVTFGGARRGSPALVGNVKTFLPFGDAWSVYVGASVATGHAPTPGEDQDSVDASVHGRRTLLAGGDLYVKYRPANRVGGYFAVALQAEYFWRRTFADAMNVAEVDAGFYAQLVAQIARRWHLGGRFDQLGVPQSAIQPKGDRISVMADFVPSEYSRVRLQGQREKVDTGGPVYEALLLLEFAIGAHGAHAF